MQYTFPLKYWQLNKSSPSCGNSDLRKPICWICYYWQNSVHQSNTKKNQGLVLCWNFTQSFSVRLGKPKASPCFCWQLEASWVYQDFSCPTVTATEPWVCNRDFSKFQSTRQKSHQIYSGLFNSTSSFFGTVFPVNSQYVTLIYFQCYSPWS